MIILVTGATGFVGKTLINSLISQKYTVRALTRHKNQIESISDLEDKDIDWRLLPSKDDIQGFRELMIGVDAIIHLAARVHVMKDTNLHSLEENMNANCYFTSELAEYAATFGVRRFVYVSSIKVNGEFTPKGERFVESSKPNPQDNYAVSKLRAEETLHNISKKSGMEIVIIRPPLVYGPFVKANFVKLLSLVKNNVPLPLKSIKNSRSLVYVGNLANALILCAIHPAAASQTYLISDDDDVSTPELISRIAESLNRPNLLLPFSVSMMKFFARLFGKTAAIDRLSESLQVDCSKIKKELGWKPAFTMKQGLEITANWFLHSTDLK